MTPLEAIPKTLTRMVGGPPDLSTRSLWSKLSRLPAGKAMFSRAVCLKAPYFGTIDPLITELRDGFCEVHAKDRRAVHNHLGTFHAIAMCNMAELAGGMATEMTVPSGARWIPTGMTVEYLHKARGNLRAVATLDPIPDVNAGIDVNATVNVLDSSDQAVMRAVITMRVSRKGTRSPQP
jgi:acyl-coenzyme A thioesterase PaaI-like protein